MTVDEKLDTIKLTDEEIVLQVEREYLNALEYRRPRIKDWHANEDMLYGRKPVTLSKRSNIDLRLMKGFEDALLSKIKEPLTVKFGPTEDADIRKARKVTALFELETSPTKQNWRYKDLLGKKLALPSGRCITKIYATKPYKHRRDPMDHYDFLIDPLAGGYDIELARYLGQDNIFKSKYDLQNNKTYDQVRVKELIETTNENDTDVTDNQYKEKQNRLAIVGLNGSDYNAQRDGLFKLLEWYTTINGKRWYILCSLDKKIIIKKKPWEEMTCIDKESDLPLWPFSSWAYYPDLFNFWSQSPMDIVREIFQTRNVVVNQAVDNNEAKNKPMKSYDPQVYTNPALLEYEPDRLVATATGKDPKAGLYIHETADIYDPKALNDILEDIASKVSGVTPASQGVSEDQKVGIYYGDQQETANRMSLFEESYFMADIHNAQLYLNGLIDKLDEAKAVKMIGENGVEWDKLTKEDLGQYDIMITGGSTQEKLDAIKNKQKADFVLRQIQNPTINPKSLAEMDAEVSGFDNEQIKKLFAQNNEDDEMRSIASEDIQKLLLGKDLKPNRKANVAYAQKIIDFYFDNEVTEEQDQRFRIYMESIQDVVMQNTLRKAQMEMAAKGQLQTPNLGQEQPDPNAPVANTPGGTISQASQITNNIKPNYVNSQPTV